MSRTLPAILLAGFGLLAIHPAEAQDAKDKGIYAVARVGGVIQPDQKLDRNGLPTVTIDETTKYKTGITGEIGAGYDFGMVRVEQTIGYTNLKLDRDKAQDGGFSANGRAKMFTATVNAYVDIPLSRTFQPYVGGGIGVSRVDANLSRVNTATRIGSGYSGKDWGMTWHADAGLGIRMNDKMTVEVGGRYSRTGKLAFDGQAAGVGTTYEPQLNAVSGTVGLRYKF
ncbi:outer membrane protein [Sphingomonas elodea]|uniref:outer membrane protein n=1 Tax=Sphingomonas elodea TaxID=179878 RepID=UPI0002630A6D|nr:outer membrane beta-barrel protein [Sphingomonas elodea]